MAAVSRMVKSGYASTNVISFVIQSRDILMKTGDVFDIPLTSIERFPSMIVLLMAVVMVVVMAGNKGPSTPPPTITTTTTTLAATATTKTDVVSELATYYS